MQWGKCTQMLRPYRPTLQAHPQAKRQARPNQPQPDSRCAMGDKNGAAGLPSNSTDPGSPAPSARPQAMQSVSAGLLVSPMAITLFGAHAPATAPAADAPVSPAPPLVPAPAWPPSPPVSPTYVHSAEHVAAAGIALAACRLALTAAEATWVAEDEAALRMADVRSALAAKEIADRAKAGLRVRADAAAAAVAVAVSNEDAAMAAHSLAQQALSTAFAQQLAARRPGRQARPVTVPEPSHLTPA